MAEENLPQEPEGSQPGKVRIPEAVRHLQVNVCKSPLCANFFVPPKPYAKRGRRPAGEPPKEYEPGDYVVTTGSGARLALICKLCGEKLPLSSNFAIAEELNRISEYLEPETLACPNDECENKSAGLIKFGVNKHGTPRFRCKGCKKAFAYGGKSTKRQRKTHINRDVFQMLMNSVPLRRIIKMLEISPGTLYNKLDFIHSQCQLFAGARERNLFNKSDLGEIYLTTDRQKLIVNWSSREDRRNTALLSMATADLASGYVFGVHVNYDQSLDAEQVYKDCEKFGDRKKPRPFRRYARVWLPEDYDTADARAFENSGQPKRLRDSMADLPPSSVLQSLSTSIDAVYAAALARQDIEGESPSRHVREPAKGMLVHEQVVLYAHMQFLAAILNKADKVFCFLDQESGLRAAFMAAFGQRVKQRTADAFYVRINKDLTIDEKRASVAKSRKRLAAIIKENPTLSEADAQIILAGEELAKMAPHGHWHDYWFSHPLPDMREPEKQVCWLTNFEPIAQDPVARAAQLEKMTTLYLKGTLSAVDRFFMQVRRALTIAERGIPSASAERRIWFGKNAYNPYNLVKLLEVFRTYFNYCEVGQDNQTPAMRLGLARGPVAPEDILYYVPRVDRGLPNEESPVSQSQDGALNHPESAG